MRMDCESGRAAKAGMASAMVLFGTVGIVTHYIDLPSSIIVMFKGIVGTLFMLFVIYATGGRLSRDDIRENALLLAASGVCLGLNWLFLFEAYKSTTVSMATLCYYLMPAFVILASPVFLKERLTASKLACVAVAILGLALVAGIFEPGALGASGARGAACGILAAVFYAMLIILNKKLRRIGAFNRTFMQLGIGTAVVVAYSLCTVDIGSLEFDGITVGLLVMLGIVHTGITFTLYFGSMRGLKAQTVAVYGYIEPVVALFLSAVILGEALGAIGWIGAAMVLGSTLASELIENRRRAKGDEEGL